MKMKSVWIWLAGVVLAAGLWGCASTAMEDGARVALRMEGAGFAAGSVYYAVENDAAVWDAVEGVLERLAGEGRLPEESELSDFLKNRGLDDKKALAGARVIRAAVAEAADAGVLYGAGFREVVGAVSIGFRRARLELEGGGRE